MVTNKNKSCLKCKRPMKFKGSRVWYCKDCDIAYHIEKQAIVHEETMGGNVISRLFKGYKYSIKKWKVKE